MIKTSFEMLYDAVGPLVSPVVQLHPTSRKILQFSLLTNYYPGPQ